MKNLKLTSLLLILLAFSACKKDKMEENPSRTIVGKWYLKKVIETTYMEGVKKEEVPSTNFGSEDYLEFKADGSCNISEDGDKDAFSYKIYLITNCNSSTKAKLKPMRPSTSLSLPLLILYSLSINQKLIRT